MGSQNEDSFRKLVSSCASNNNPQNEGEYISSIACIPNIAMHAAILCDLIYEYLQTEHRQTPLLSDQDQNQPAITRNQQRLFVLLTALADMPRWAGNIIGNKLGLSCAKLRTCLPARLSLA